MKVKTQWLLTAFLLLFVGGWAQAQKTVVIKGHILDDLHGYSKVFLDGKDVSKDSATVTDSVFKFTLTFEKPVVVLLYDEYSLKAVGGNRFYPVLIDRPGTIDIRDIRVNTGFYGGTFTGMQSAKDLHEFNDLQDAAFAEINKIISAKYPTPMYLSRNGSETPEQKSYREDMEALTREKLPAVIAGFVEAHPDAYASAYILNSIGFTYLTPDDLNSNNSKLSKRVRQTDAGQNVTAYLAGLKNSEIGQYVKNFSLSTPQNKQLAFSKLKGKYVLIDFWASWCTPCIASFQHMKEVYAKYKNPQFEIYSISIDQSKAAWLKALQEQQLPWLQSLDTKNVASEGFAVNAVPTTFLIDPNGKILMKDVGFTADGSSPFEKKIAELFGKK